MRNIIIAICVIGLFFTAGCAVEKPIGGEKDEHGCLPAAGYTWCESKQKCLRIWEEPCPGMVTNFEECAALGYPVMESYPRQCRTPEGDMFVEEVEGLIPGPEAEETLSPDECIAKGGRTVNIAGGAVCDKNETNIGKVIGFISPNICCLPFEQMTIEEALDIAEESDCLIQGKLTERYFYNEFTNTWWIDLEMKEEFEKEYCNPACVVYTVAKEAEINWRCTGVLPG